MALAEDAIEIPALGRPFQLGMLYDCRKDALIPGVTLWDYSSLQKDLTIKPQPKTATEIIASDTIDDKASALNISASLKKSRRLPCRMLFQISAIIGEPERRIVLVGESRSGKSATGNAILGRKVFEFGISRKSITQTCQKEDVLLNGRKVVVVDTPGFCNIDRPDEDIAAEVRKCMTLCTPGPHVILQVMSREETYPARQITEVFGLKAMNYTIILFTSKEGPKGESLGSFILSRDEKLKEYIAECGNRCLALNSTAEGEERAAQVAELMTMIDDLVERNRDAPCYTEDMMNVNKSDR